MASLSASTRSMMSALTRSTSPSSPSLQVTALLTASLHDLPNSSAHRAWSAEEADVCWCKSSSGDNSHQAAAMLAVQSRAYQCKCQILPCTCEQDCLPVLGLITSTKGYVPETRCTCQHAASAHMQYVDSNAHATVSSSARYMYSHSSCPTCLSTRILLYRPGKSSC